MLTTSQILAKINKAKALKNTKTTTKTTESTPEENPDKLNISPLIDEIDNQELYQEMNQKETDEPKAIKTKPSRPKKRTMVVEEDEPFVIKDCCEGNCNNCECVKNIATDEVKSQNVDSENV